MFLTWKIINLNVPFSKVQKNQNIFAFYDTHTPLLPQMHIMKRTMNGFQIFFTTK